MNRVQGPCLRFRRVRRLLTDIALDSAFKMKDLRIFTVIDQIFTPSLAIRVFNK
jgi:hypothetical protein